MARRPHLNECIEWLHKYARNEEEDLVAKQEALDLAAKLEPLAYLFEHFYETRKGRHARLEERAKQWESDLRCYKLVEQLRRAATHKRMSLNEAFLQWGGERQEETVRKAYYRGKKLNQRKTRSRERT